MSAEQSASLDNSFGPWTTGGRVRVKALPNWENVVTTTTFQPRSGGLLEGAS